jgi:Asp-tRNA(Asn)/Glu-tRNA(Gln) amidotransferase A subunit family amidase
LPAGLSAREADVLALVARGHPNKAIATRLGISAKTVGHPTQRSASPRAPLASMRLVVPVNLLGLPAVAVAGVQVIGPRFGETLCLDAAAAIEAAGGETYPFDPRETGARV